MGWWRRYMVAEICVGCKEVGDLEVMEDGNVIVE